MDRTLEGRTALVTGGGTNIGRGIARRLLEHGAVVTIAARRREVLEATAEELRREVEGAVVHVAVGDVTNGQDMEDAVAVATAGSAGRLDVAVANAGGSAGRKLADAANGAAPERPEAPETKGAFFALDGDDWRRVCDLNIVGTANTFRAAALAMSEGGALVAISSTDGAAPQLAHPHYSTAKAALGMLVRCAAIELGPLGIRVNAVLPGFTPAPATLERLPAAMQEELIAQTWMGRYGTPRDIADTVVHLAGQTGSWITGQSIAVDGGMSVRPGPDMMRFLKPAAAGR
jgi:NAD(P)-dependent dehydrogenase (short-subunit alcohol dehydrogenase family)